MPAEKYTKNYLEEKLPAELREHHREDNLDPNRLPTYVRQTWHTKYFGVLRDIEVHIAIVADEADTKQKKHVANSYIPDSEERESIRDLANEKFQDIMPLEELPEPMAQVLDQENYMGGQAELGYFTNS